MPNGGKNLFENGQLIGLERRTHVSLYAARAEAGAEITGELGVEEIVGNEDMVYSKHSALNVSRERGFVNNGTRSVAATGEILQSTRFSGGLRMAVPLRTLRP